MLDHYYSFLVWHLVRSFLQKTEREAEILLPQDILYCCPGMKITIYIKIIGASEIMLTSVSFPLLRSTCSSRHSVAIVAMDVGP